MIGAWLLLPPYTLAIAGLPDYSKNTAATLGMMLGTLIFGPDRLLRFRPRWFDLPMLLWCFSGICSSLQNGLGLYDGLSDSLGQILTWGLPYLIGRLYFGDLEGLRTFAVAMVVGGLCYVLPCLWEIRMSPQLLRRSMAMELMARDTAGRLSPARLLLTGLELGMWMTAASLRPGGSGGAARSRGSGGSPSARCCCRSCWGRRSSAARPGRWSCWPSGMMAALVVRPLPRRGCCWPASCSSGPVYVAVRVTNLWSGQQAVDLAEALVGPERAESLEYRFKCENLLIARAIQQPVFGWGGWGRSSVYFDADKPYAELVPTDGLWIIFLGTKGFVGLTCSTWP